MERCSYFIQGKALFGSFPTQETVNLLEGEGVRFFIDLTNSNEQKTIPYKTNYSYIKYPIEDRQIPLNWKSFAQLVLELSSIIDTLAPNEKVYIHCRGGHGRSGILVASILCHYLNYPPDEAIKHTSHCHSKRPEMREKWRKLGSPQGKKQRDFVHRFFKPLKFGRHDNIFTVGMNNNSCHSVVIDGVGTFPNAVLAFQSFRCSHPEYIKKLTNGEFDPSFIQESPDWNEKKIDYMYKVLDCKFRQHPELKYNLVNTGLRPLIKSSLDSFWGDGGHGQGYNIHGKLLAKLRFNYLREDFRNLE